MKLFLKQRERAELNHSMAIFAGLSFVIPVFWYAINSAEVSFRHLASVESVFAKSRTDKSVSSNMYLTWLEPKGRLEESALDPFNWYVHKATDWMSCLPSSYLWTIQILLQEGVNSYCNFGRLFKLQVLLNICILILCSWAVHLRCSYTQTKAILLTSLTCGLRLLVFPWFLFVCRSFNLEFTVWLWAEQRDLYLVISLKFLIAGGL